MDLVRIAKVIEDIFKKSLDKKIYRYGMPQRKGVEDKTASNSLRNSIKAIPYKNEIGIEMNNYGKFVQSGRLKGKKGVPINALILWIKQRGITAKDKNGKVIPAKSLAFAIQKSQRKFGIPSQPGWYDVAFEDLYNNKQIEELLGQVTVDDLIDKIEGI